MKLTKDVTIWMTDELHKMLTKVIMAKENHPRIYYIMVVMKDHYMGPTAVRHNHLLNKGKAGIRTMDLSGKHVLHNRLILIDNPPPVPLISTSLWRIDNKAGRAKCCYILPPDKPILYGEQMGESSEFIFRSAQGAPLIYGVNN